MDDHVRSELVNRLLNKAEKDKRASKGAFLIIMTDPMFMGARTIRIEEGQSIFHFVYQFCKEHTGENYPWGVWLDFKDDSGDKDRYCFYFDRQCSLCHVWDKHTETWRKIRSEEHYIAEVLKDYFDSENLMGIADTEILGRC